MKQLTRILVAMAVLLLLATGSALAAGAGKSNEHRSPVAASHQPEQPGSSDADEQGEAEDAEDEDVDGGAPSEKLLTRLADRLGVDADTIASLAAGYGVGGAVRILAWAGETGVDAGEIAAMFDAGAGWGEIARELDPDGELGIHPGLGSIMGNGAAAGAPHGRDSAPGQQKKQQ